jgi:hypothetical protein
MHRIAATLPMAAQRMKRAAQAMVESDLAPAVAGVILLLAAMAWPVSAGLSVALVYYGVAIGSLRLCRLCRADALRQRSLGMLGLALAWLLVLAFSATVLPSNFSVPLL